MTNNTNNSTNCNNNEASPNSKEAMWLIVSQNNCYGEPYKTFNCSHCGTVFSEQNEWVTYYHYCPTCGYHMRRSDWDEIEKAMLTKKQYKEEAIHNK